MQPLLAQMPNPVFLTHLVDLECYHYPKKLSDNVILRREPKNLEILRVAQDDNCSLRGVYPELCRRTQNDGRRNSLGCRTVFPVYFRDKETQYQRHEVCLKYKGSKSGASIRWCLVFVGNEEA